MLDRKLRWCTLGGQYDWTAKVYPTEKPPAFPPDIAGFLEGLFPAMKAEAAIVNVYSPRDTLSMHRDVAEESERGLVSISLGCDALFVAGLGTESTGQDSSPNEQPPLVVRLRSGDAVFMGGDSRFAWHGVPQVIPETCPDYLANWPGGNEGETTEFEAWKGWMSGKRVNLNVRQMWD
jgi:alkylated DNA repair protein alkB family protein 1